MSVKAKSLRKATIADVARLAGVSIKTVSRVANKEPNVRVTTRERVQEAIDALSYRPDPSARSLAGNRSYLIGLLYDNPSASYLIKIQSGSLVTSRAEGYGLVIHPCDYKDVHLRDEISSMVATSRVDGIILTPPLSDMPEICALLRDLGVVYSRIAPLDREPEGCEVYTNDREVCSEMTSHLASLGHRRIAFIKGHPDHKALGERFAGYVDGLKQNGIEVDDTLVIQGYNSFESGASAAAGLLQLATPPTAIFAANDDMAAGVMRTAHTKGLKIPADVSVAGFDDIPLASQLWPALTTIRQPMQEMAARASELLLQKLREQDYSEVERTIASTVVLRESTGPVDG